MSTRAIIAIPGTYKKNKGYITAWCWNDGGPDNLGKELKKYFTNEKIIKKLIKLHSFSSILDKKDILELLSADDRITYLENKRFVLQHSHQGQIVEGEGRNGFFESIEDMLQCDINYVYVFEENEWKMYK